jgi:hypothetical protein
MSDTELIHDISPERLTELLQNAGYRVNSSEQNGQIQLLSASQGIGFAVRFGNPAAETGRFLDYTFSCALRVQGELPAGLVGQWNVTKRFARMTEQGGFLVLEMDVVAAGGIADTHLRANTELWDRLLQEFLLYLRTFAAQSGAAQGSAAQDKPQEADAVDGQALETESQEAAA